MTNQKSYVSNKKVLLVSQKHKLKFLVYKYGGEGGIRTHGTVAGTLVFKTRALNHSTTSPEVYSVVVESNYYSKRLLIF